MLKRFDRARYAPPVSDLLSRANTWGTRPPGDEARAAATEASVLDEIRSCADLGVDALAIDDGWQYPAAGRDGGEASAAAQIAEKHEPAGGPAGPLGWQPHPDRFPAGWSTVRRAAAEAGVQLDLWIAGASASLEQLARNIERGGFKKLKIDFLNLPTRDLLDLLLEKTRRLAEHTRGRPGTPEATAQSAGECERDADASETRGVRISWDVTENAPRLGYYLGREYGTLHVANRKPTYDYRRVHHIAYTPRLVLRDAWHLSRFINLAQVEIPIQDVDRIDPEISNAGRYSHAYCTAIALMGVPLFFQETKFLSKTARDQIRPILSAWKAHRDRIGEGYVYPVGDEPCDAAWTGFQCHRHEEESGYVLVFRELYAGDEEAKVGLHFLQNTELEWTDVLSGETWRASADAAGAVQFALEHPASFRWLSYRAV